MQVLGIHDGHNSSACLLVDGSIKWAIQEERLTNDKNCPGMPETAITEILKHADTLDEVVLATNFIHRADWYRKQEFWEKSSRDYYLNKVIWPLRRRFHPYFMNRLRDRKRTLCTTLKSNGFPGWNESDIKVVEHHTAHAASAFYCSHYEPGEPILVITADGSGDGLSATASTGDAEGNLTRHDQFNSTRDESIGEIYSLTTHYLGFRPWEHEYKLMGMAPYSRPHAQVLRGLQQIIGVHNGKFVSTISADFAYDHLKKLYYRKRFDQICASLQLWFEKTMEYWVRDLIDDYGLPRKLACAGGDFMNVKANMLLTQMPEVEDIFFMPSAGDESTSIGAALKVYADWCLEHDIHPKKQIPSLGALYLGPEAKPEYIEDQLKFQDTPHWEVWRENNIEKFAAQLLEEDNIVARCSGRLEFGARALGNRTIMADATNTDNITELNARIKHRDFWMPFTPSILHEERKRLLENSKDIRAPYMILCFPSTEDSRKELKAAMHSWDYTVRPQIVEEEWNPGYWKILDIWREMTGNGGLLNTSFNLHGYPIVNDSRMALQTMAKSGLEYLIVDDHVIRKTAQ